ncbi:adenyl-nucleotide exchange factor sse1 [Brettanomyces nanus]|uniref:Adenyl-nucleotide exchange factor sse1 n=1 Tax=Eeniella nana TaxID=13502 RepID=A0A875S8K7_EENNA|nr:adenyl-nucleotide exchange factor sse1 [Brettanomyces nanus]QPG76535.1 adenyl-nucleotide exchange factor sse1 [Brettanomyces nanus]
MSATIPFGVDLGNNSSVVAVARNRGIDIVVNDVSNRSTPSVVGFGRKNRAIGEAGENQKTSNLKNTISNLKRLLSLSTKSPDYDVEKKYASYNLVDKNGLAAAQVKYQGQTQEFTSTELVAMYLNKLKSITEKETKANVSDICLAIPAWYTEEQRRAAADACLIAGLNPVRIVNDVTAAAVGYGVFKTDLPEDKPKIVAFIDVGHSSYTCSIVALKKGELKVLGTAYDKHFGGRDFDRAITEHLADEFKVKYHIDIRTNAKAYSRVMKSAEKVKKVLSANTSAPVNVESVMNDVDAQSSMTREELEELVQPLLKKVNLPIENALKIAGLSVDQIDSIELIGGCTRVPSLKAKISEVFGKQLSFTLNQDEAIARGVAFICAIHSPTMRVKPFKFEDINSFSVTYWWDKGEEDADHLEVFPKNASYPSTKMITLYRTGDFQIQAKYTNPEELPTGTDEHIATWDITGVEIPEGEESAACKIKVRQDPSGFYTIQSGYIVQEKEFKELVEKPAEEEAEKPKEDDKKEEKKEDADADVDSKADDDVQEEAEPEYRIVKKLVKVKDLNIAYKGHALSKDALAESLEKEFKMVADDKLVAETEDRKNALEEYIYDLRGKVDAEYADFASDSEKESLKKKLSEAEDWLYEDGYDTTKARYIAKCEELASTGNLIKARYNQKQEELKEKFQKKREQKAQKQMAEKLAKQAQTAKKQESKKEKEKKMKDAEGDAVME